ncbi:hypothetical protein GCM10010172_17490 [Paractinoplanes ferrugineus]|uniref:Uncharacterized protein n=1 Tax=Paractinoplanes ferrugineus TaxID=113564 RepID=A0A919MDD5_9ACTN|nr:hypothetical protein Afe05nite_34830 [Actinoplanes ferrugineus]
MSMPRKGNRLITVDGRAYRSARLDNWLNLPGTPVTPLIVEQSVRAALADGWEPNRGDGVFRLTLKD